MRPGGGSGRRSGKAELPSNDWRYGERSDEDEDVRIDATGLSGWRESDEDAVSVIGYE